MGEQLKEKVIKALKNVRMEDGVSIVDKGIVSEVVIANGKVYFALEAKHKQPHTLEPLCRQAEAVVSALPGVRGVAATITNERSSGQNTSLPPGPNSQTAKQTNSLHQDGQADLNLKLSGVQSIIAVASGKGGVGKSTVSVNLALALQTLGLKVGILDADVYGPSAPKLLGINEELQTGEDGNIIPLQAYGIKVMSMGFLVSEATPVVWRGPMVMSALNQMLHKVSWAPLDILVIDMPPGTGDVQLTIAQQTPMTGALIVSTPQDLALIDARKGINMFKKVHVPILGVIENMSYFLCPHCHERSNIFGHGGAQNEATKIGAEFLGAVPLHMDIRETSDEGRPIVVSDPSAQQAQIFIELARKVHKQIIKQDAIASTTQPKIIME